MSDPRTGTVTFLMTDIEGSTALWERDASLAGEAIRRHDALFEETVPEFGGTLIRSRGEGDSMFCVFASAPEAVACAWRLQRLIEAISPPPAPSQSGDGEEVPIRVRMAIHTGDADHRAGAYYGQAVNRCARIRGAASGGQVVVSQATQLLVRQALPEGVALGDLGNHRLKDLLMPERLFQLQDASAPRTFPPLRSLNLLPHNLPLQLTSFVGRDEEVGGVRKLLSEHRLVTVTGLGGSGKTRLALQVAADSLDVFPGGAWMAELATANDSHVLTRAIADALSLDCEEASDLPGRVHAGFEGERLLLVLDNCEQIASEVAAVAIDLLRRCPGLTILATSREPLRAAGEWVYSIPPMSLPSEEEGYEEALATEAVRLFSDRASALDSSFRITPENIGAIGEICRRLAGIPLAIEQVASNLTLLSPQQILARWKEGFPALGSDSRSAVERHETLRACFDWSYAMLSVGEQELFRVLGIFVGGWMLDAAEAVRGADIAGLLKSLVLKSLVVIDEQTGAERRYRYLEPVRQYAVEKLGEDEDLSARHLDWCLSLAQRADPNLSGSEQAAWLEILDSEHDNLRAALRWSISKGNPSCLALATALRRFWYWRGYLAEGSQWLEAALDACHEENLDLRAYAYNAIGAMCSQLSRTQEARQAYEASISLWQRLGDETQVEAGRHNLAILLSEAGSYDEALRHFAESLERYRELANDRGIASCLLNISVCHIRLHDPEPAIAYLNEALEIFEREEDLALVASVQRNLASAYQKAGCQDEARGATRQSFLIYREIKDPPEIAGGLLELASILVDAGEFEDAAIVLGAAVAARKKTGARRVPAQEEERVTLATEAIENALGDAAKGLIRQGKSLSLTAAIEFAIHTCHESPTGSARIELF